jgi:ADP-ribose pyrophosphatase YjhB (NUDIX family)
MTRAFENDTQRVAHAHVAVAGVVIRDELVLVDRATHREKFTRPSVFVEAGEGLGPALAREFHEETGLIAGVDDLLLVRWGVATHENSDAYYAFVVHRISSVAWAHPREIAEVKEVPLDEAISVEWNSDAS